MFASFPAILIIAMDRQIMRVATTFFFFFFFLKKKKKSDSEAINAGGSSRLMRFFLGSEFRSINKQLNIIGDHRVRFT